jgi:hypothetical protein
MFLEFKLYELKETSKLYNSLVKKENNPNEFVVVGEELENFKVQQIEGAGEDIGITLLDGLSIEEFSLLIPKEDLKFKGDGVGVEITELDIPKKYLSLDIVENIQRLNG